MKYVIHSGGGDLYGPFDTVEEAVKYAEEHSDEIGDYDIQPLAK